MNRFLVYILLICMTSCGEAPKRATHTVTATLKGHGSSFMLPMTDKLFKDYQSSTTVKIDYISENSYAGIDSIIANEVDFALATVHLTDAQAKAHPDVLHIPVAAAGINFAYNVPGFILNADPIYITPEILVKILDRKITNWNDPEIYEANQIAAVTKDRTFPDLPITFIQRSENSGDTYLLTKFLSKATPTWKGGVTNKLPMNNYRLEGKSALDLMTTLVQTPGALTYTTMIYGIQNNIPLIRIRNFLGTYGRGCNFRSTEAMKVAQTNIDNRVDFTYPQHPTQAKEAGVATGVMYMLVKQEQNYNNKTKEQAQELVDLIDWMLSPVAQRELDPLFFAALTPKFRHASRVMLSNMTYNGEQLLPTQKD